MIKRCPICNNKIEDNQRTCIECTKVLKANPHLTIVDLM
jgi:predicted nucleic acid-binding Zn ribbon protein